MATDRDSLAEVIRDLEELSRDEHFPWNAEVAAKALDEIDRLLKEGSHWKAQYKFACDALQMFIDEYERAEGTTIEPTPELIDLARLHCGRSNSPDAP